MTNLDRYKEGRFHECSIGHHDDGSQTFTLKQEGDETRYIFTVRDLYGEHEELLEEYELPAESRPWIRGRMEEAQRQHGKGRAVDPRDL